MLLLLLHQLLLLKWLHLLLVYKHWINLCFYTCNLQTLDSNAIFANLLQITAMGVVAHESILHIDIGSMCCNCCCCCSHPVPCRWRRPCGWHWRRHLMWCCCSCRWHCCCSFSCFSMPCRWLWRRHWWPWLLLQPSVVVLLLDQ